LNFKNLLFAIWYTLWPFDLFYGNLVYFAFICYIITISNEEKYVNPAINYSNLICT
jgi:hypothetical protein